MSIILSILFNYSKIGIPFVSLRHLCSKQAPFLRFTLLTVNVYTIPFLHLTFSYQKFNFPVMIKTETIINRVKIIHVV